jgi:hypothetical protein
MMLNELLLAADTDPFLISSYGGSALSRAAVEPQFSFLHNRKNEQRNPSPLDQNEHNRLEGFFTKEVPPASIDGEFNYSI